MDATSNTGCLARQIGGGAFSSGDQQTVARNGLFNSTWTMTVDLCSAAMPKPGTWGTFVFQ